MIHISLFSGIGGFELAAEWMGWRNYVSCDISEFGNKVRKYYWPDCYSHNDVKTLTYETIHTELSRRYGSGWRDDDIILTGGFPCQPYSQAGRRLGSEDERHLWPEMLRVISEVKPTYILGENVYGLVNWSEGLVFEEVCADLENLGYAVQPVLLPASGIGAPHHRMRVFFVAYAIGNGHKNGYSQTGGEVGCSQPRGVQQSERVGGERNAPDTISDGLCERKNTGDISENQGAMGGERGQLTDPAETDGTERDAADTNCGRLEGATEIGRDCEYVIGQGILGNATDTGSEGLQGGELHRTYGESERQQSKSYGTTAELRQVSFWERFPSVEPTIRSRDDGFSHRLDDITFPRWRIESIKAYGNAVVPPLIYTIFKAIDELRSKDSASASGAG